MTRGQPPVIERSQQPKRWYTDEELERELERIRRELVRQGRPLVDPQPRPVTNRRT